MKNSGNLIIIFIILIAVGFIYRRLEDKRIREEEKDDYEAIRQYLLNDETLADSKKPILWIHVPYEYNARNWQSFGSRSSFELNQPYLYLTAKSIIKHCERSFRICLIDDKSFKKIIPDWNINMDRMAQPISDKIRAMAMIKLVYIYGGLICPLSFLCMKDMISLYEKGVQGNKMFVCENIDRNITSTSYEFYPNMQFMGAVKGNQTISKLIDFMQRTISSDFTAQSVFLGDFNRWINGRIEKNEVYLINGMDVGTKTVDSNPVLLEDLMSQNYVDFFSKMYGIWIPAADLLKRRKYEWFVRLSAKQVLEADTILSKYMVVANAPDQGHLIAPLKAKPKWVSFWEVPSQAPVWGLKPNFLGNQLLQKNHPGNPGTI